MQRILIVDDEMNIRNLVRKYGESAGFDVIEAIDGEDAIKRVEEADPDIIVMDIMMPVLDGFSAAKEIRKTSAVPIIMLSARDEEYNRIHGFEAGADDYVTKPFSGKELMLRINAILNRGQKSSEQLYEAKDLKVDFNARIVWIEGERVELSPKEYDLLFFMINHRGLALSRQLLLNKIWGFDYYGDDRTIDTHIKVLRKDLGVCGSYIVTLRGLGYRFEPLPITT
ncbi:MAG: response regulator transcription factor [Christensenellaceae bacterium]|jgi:DNA-binding response OmpR family regulator|nr:response regulator transcription factor [Christensenellaceae bacterium]